MSLFQRVAVDLSRKWSLKEHGPFGRFGSDQAGYAQALIKRWKLASAVEHAPRLSPWALLLLSVPTVSAVDAILISAFAGCALAKRACSLSARLQPKCA